MYMHLELIKFCRGRKLDVCASERQLARLRFAFLEAVLSQDVIGAFDTDLSGGKIITGVTNHMSIIQDAIGEKVRAYIFDQFHFKLLSEKQSYGPNIIYDKKDMKEHLLNPQLSY